MSDFPNTDMDLGFGSDPVSPPQVPTVNQGGTITLTQEQFQQLLNRGSQAVEQDYAAALTGQEQELPQQPELDLSNLPNPAQDPEGFRTGLAQVLVQGANQIAEQTQINTQRVNDANQAYAAAWDLMRERYPGIAVHNEIVQMAAAREWDALRSRGIDPVTALQHNMDDAVEAVATRAQATINKVRGLQEGEDPQDYDRTEMLSGSGPGYNVPKTTQQNKQQTSFVDDLKKLQRELGIY